jgi:hypothetical protein
MEMMQEYFRILRVQIWMSAPDKEEFKEAMVKEVNSHSDNVNWIVMN